jgi:hypothetical protein
MLGQRYGGNTSNERYVLVGVNRLQCQRLCVFPTDIVTSKLKVSCLKSHLQPLLLHGFNFQLKVQSENWGWGVKKSLLKNGLISLSASCFSMSQNPFRKVTN